MCVDESVHVLFDETNSLIEHDTQDEKLELGLMRRDFSPTQSSIVDNGKAPESERSAESENVEGEWGAHQSRGSNAGPTLVQNRLDFSRTDLGAGSKTDPESVSPHSQERLESMSVDSIIPRP